MGKADHLFPSQLEYVRCIPDAIACFRNGADIALERDTIRALDWSRRGRPSRQCSAEILLILGHRHEIVQENTDV